MRREERRQPYERKPRARPTPALRSLAGAVAGTSGSRLRCAGPGPCRAATGGPALATRTAASARAEAVDGDLRLRHARHRLQRQSDQPELDRHAARDQAADLRERVRQGRQHVRGRSPEPAGREDLDADGPRRAQDPVRVRVVRHRRRRGTDDVPPAPRLRRTGRVRCGPVLEPVHGHRRVPELARVPGARRAWCSSGTSRFAGCRSRATRG